MARLSASRPRGRGWSALDELKNIEALSGLDDYQLDDIGASHTQICGLARTSAEDPRGEHRSFN